jgi:hypothetical protein
MEAIFVNGLHDYDYYTEVTNDGVIHSIFASNGEHWSEHYRNGMLVSVTDNGNGFVFNHSRPKKEINYHDALILSILLKKISFNDHTIEVCGEKKPL